MPHILIKTVLVILSLTLSGCIEDMKTKDHVIIPKSVLFGNPDKTGIALSPDGEYITYLAPVGGVLNLHIAKADNLNEVRILTHEKKRAIDGYTWALDGIHILFQKDNDGDENYALHTLNVNTGEFKKITKDGFRTSIIGMSYKKPHEILININERRQDYFDVYHFDIKTGELKLVYENDSFIQLVADDNLKLRFAGKLDEEGGQELYQFNDDHSYKLFEKFSMEDTQNSGVLGIIEDSNMLYMRSSKGRDTSALFKIDLATGDRKLIAESAKTDISSIILHPKTDAFQGYIVNYDKVKYHITDDAFKVDYEYLASLEKGSLRIADRTHENDRWIVAFVLDDGPVNYYLYDRNKQHATFLFSNKKDLHSYKLNKMQPVVIHTRDGLEMVSYLTKPAHKTGPMPLVLLVHGGPQFRDHWGYSSVHQWLSNRGYAVLSVNYRGSTGFGKNYINQGNGQWAAKMHDDLIDAVNWAIDTKITTKDKVAIMGGSYGGYATLVGLTFTPDVFACGVDIVGPSNLETFANSVPPYWKPAKASLKRMLGADPDSEEGRKILASKSPLTYADRIIRPLLIGQGANDPRVKEAESTQIVEKMKAHKVPVTYVLFPDEGHGFARPDNSIAFYNVAEKFLANCLQGEYEDDKEALSRSTAKVSVSE